MHKNITLSNLSIENSGSGNHYKKHVASKIGIAVTEFFLSSVLYCYGIIFCEYISLEYDKFGTGIFAAIMFIVSWNFTDPISRFIVDTLDDRKGILMKYLLIVGSCTLFMCISIPYDTYSLLLYTVSSGIIYNILSNQLYSYAVDKLDMDHRIYEVIRQIAHAVSLVSMPHLVFFLVDHFQLNHAKLIYGTLLLLIIPASLLIKLMHDLNTSRYPEMSRYETIGRYNYQLNDLKTFDNGLERESSKSSLTSAEESLDDQTNFFLNQENPEGAVSNVEPRDNFEEGPFFGTSFEETVPNSPEGMKFENYGMEETYIVPSPDPSTSMNPVSSKYYVQKCGVCILPDIPEESEDEDEHEYMYIDPKRLSMISSKLEELNIQEQSRKESLKEVFSIDEIIRESKPEPIKHIEYISNFKNDNRVSLMDELKRIKKSRYCCSCSPYKKYIWTRRLRVMKDFMNDNFLRPFYYSIKNIYFYPCLTTKTVNNLMTTLYITLGPKMVLEEGDCSHEGRFLLSYVAFAWAFFLFGLPLFVRLNRPKMRIMFSLGLAVSGSSFLLLSVKWTNDVITLSSLLFGFGYGLTRYSEKIVYRSSVGMRPWYFIQGPLEVLSAIFILVIYYVLYMYHLNCRILLAIAAISYFTNAFLWLCLPLMNGVASLLKRLVFDQRSQQEDLFQ
ncbi:hypothetical protein GWI33_019917 [Rhynchophorus ferrugineus]|uniref:Uncharacterized protein n=1 Tax=Rhynchophorus ferrugineus TaxID=354439 RepID=A0A834HSH0_RHYFE|nr:hypothetical protein GWI33_019917 [Rhynchophorus ferrugineus]